MFSPKIPIIPLNKFRFNGSPSLASKTSPPRSGATKKSYQLEIYQFAMERSTHFFRKVNHLFRLGPSKNHGKLLVITSGKIPRSLGFFRPNPSGKCAQTSVIPFPPSTGSQFSPGSCPRNVSQERAQRHGMVFFNLKCWLIMVNQPWN